MPAKKRSKSSGSSSKKKSAKSSRSSGSSGSKASAPQSLNDLLVLKLQALYDVESQLVKALPKMVKKASEQGLKQALDSHAAQTKGHVERLDRAFESLGTKSKALKVDAIRGLVSDAEWVMKTVKEPALRDAGMIAAAQYVEHYEMAGYGTAAEWARILGHGDVSALLQQTLQEEKDADAILNTLAESQVNEKTLS